MSTYCAFAIGAYIVAILAITQFAERVIQVADTATRTIGLTGNLPVVLKQLMKRDEHSLKVNLTGVASTASACADGR